jgi:phenylalanyl-tRNA synthetase alpha subunit
MFINAKKQHFKKKLEGVQKRIWDVEFLRSEYKATREGFRSEYDRLKELQDAANVRIASEKEKEDPDKTIIEQLTKLKERYDPDMDQLKKQMDNMDLLIEGPAPQGSPQQPINTTLDGLRSVMVRLSEVIKKI